MDSATGAGPPSGAPPHAPFFRRWQLYLLAIVAAIYVGTSALAPVPWIQFPLGLLTLFIVPGYAIGWLALARRDRLPWTLTFALVVGWSVAENVGVGLLLLLLHWGLPPLVLAGSAFVLIEAALIVETLSIPPEVAPEPGISPLAASLRMTGYRPRQRWAAYGLLTAILLVLVVIVLLASIFPNNTPALAFSITGYGGTSANLPPAGSVNGSLDIEAIVQNNATAQSFTVEVRSAAANATPGTYRAIPWSLPLVLGNGTSASDPVSLTSSQSLTVDIVFEFPATGNYLLQFLLEASDGAIVGRATWTVAIT